MKNTNKYGKSLKFFGVLSAMIVLMLALALNGSATPQLTLNTLTWQEGTMVNISTKDANDDSLINITYITLLFSATDTANNTVVKVYNISNGTATNFDEGYANFTFGSDLIFEDTAIGLVTGLSTGNETASLGMYTAVTLSATTITIDRTAPSTPTDVSPGSITSDSRDQTFSATVTGTDTTGCNLLFTDTNPGSTSYSMTHIGDSCTISLVGISQQTYQYRIVATDGTGANDSTTAEFTLNLDGTGSSKRKAIVVGAMFGGGTDPASVSKGLSIFGDIKSGSEVAKNKIGDRLANEAEPIELVKTGGGAVIGAAIGASGFLGGPLGFVTVPLGALIGGIIGFIL